MAGIPPYGLIIEPDHDTPSEQGAPVQPMQLPCNEN